MAASYATSLRNARNDQITSAIGSAGLFNVYDGTRPAFGGAATNLLASFTMGTPFAPASVAGVLSPTLPSNTTGLANGTATGALVINDRPDSWLIRGTSDSNKNGATNYWGRIKEKHHLHPDAPDYSKAIAEAIRQEQIARAEKQRLEKQLKAVEVPPKPTTRKPKIEPAKPWVDKTKQLRRRIEIQDSLIAQARSAELALRLQAIQAERIAKQNQEQEDILLILMAMDD